MSDDPIYLDHNATTPLRPEVVDAMIPYLRAHFGNPSSAHVYGARARAAVERARAQVAALLGCDPDEVVFTSGGTEANNLAIRGVGEALGRPAHVVTTAIEHPATSRPCAWLAGQGHRVTVLPVDADGRALVPDRFDDDVALLTVMHANNETGVLQPVAALAARARAVGAVVHTDAAQSVGKVPVQVRALDVDLLTVAGHKLYAPKGVGALYVRRGTALAPFARGASHERGLRPGTENVASLVGLGVACELAARDLDDARARLATLRDALWERLSRAVPGLARNGHAVEVLPNTLSVRFPRASGSAVLAGAPEVAASTGSACHEGHESASAGILALGVPPDEALGTVRLTLGHGSTPDEVLRAADALARSWSRLTAA
ncbi:MAG: cysteine desulfurase family protein [Polyangiales bacterium]